MDKTKHYYFNKYNHNQQDTVKKLLPLLITQVKCLNKILKIIKIFLN